MAYSTVVHTHVCMCVCVYVCVYVCMYMYMNSRTKGVCMYMSGVLPRTGSHGDFVTIVINPSLSLSLSLHSS